MRHRTILLLALAALLLVSPAQMRAWQLVGSTLRQIPVPAQVNPVHEKMSADFDQDGNQETLSLTGGHASIQTREQIRWRSPLSWQVRQALISDLNQDGRPEAALLLWRPFQPWPVDAWLPHGGRIVTFHNSNGDSCHIILIGWFKNSFRERWAGSALAEPVESFAAADLTGSGEQFLVTLEARYDDPASAPARFLKVWEWNGFGFNLVSTTEGPFREMALAQALDGRMLILTPKEISMQPRRNRLLFPASIVLLISIACSLFTAPVSTPVPLASPTMSAPLPTLPEGVYAPEFAPYQPVAVNLPVQFNGGDYTLPVDLGAVQYAGEVEISAGQRQVLSQNGFVVLPPEPGQYREFYQIYESGRYDFRPVFITTDSLYHVYHLLFDKMLRDLERDSFISILDSLTGSMLAASYEQYTTLKGTTLEEPARRNVAFFAVAAQLLGLPDPVPAEVTELVSAELALINAAGGPQISPIWDRDDLPDDKKLIEDYSQYIPRGHYTRSEELEKYFRTMMWYGRLTYRLRDEFETRRALLMTQTLRTASAADGTPAVALWQNIYEPTVFIVGKADDLSFFEYGALMDSIFGENPDPASFADEGKFAAFMETAKNLPPPQVNSMWVWIWEDAEQATKGLRFMGQRFTLDAYVFGQVIWRKVGTQSNPRGLPKGLDFMAAMGSAEAYAILKDMGENQYANYETQMAKVRTEISALGVDSWTQNLYWNWLYSIQPLLAPKDSRYPAFMRTQAWTRKELQTALGSWTELKHDTILYAKQVIAEMGGGGPEQEPPHSFVEPNPEAYARLLALANMTRAGLAQRSLLSDLAAANLDNLISELEFLQRISEAELNGQEISAEDYWHMYYWGGVLEQFTLAAADQEPGGNRPILEDQKAALIADVATGLAPDGTLVALEEAIGQPTVLYVVLPGQPVRLAAGAVFSYYEFPVPVSNRMTDEQWQALVEGGTNPVLPDWMGLFIVP
jgi:hypothetical protein